MNGHFDQNTCFFGFLELNENFDGIKNEKYMLCMGIGISVDPLGGSTRFEPRRDAQNGLFVEPMRVPQGLNPLGDTQKVFMDPKRQNESPRP